MPNVDYTRTLDDVAEAVANARERGVKVCLLIGAGCSYSAGIPLASGFQKIIEDKYPHAYAKASAKSDDPSYADCMAALAVGERRHLIREYIREANINHAHLGIAQLIKAGYVDRVLTTNFDPLVAEACRLCNTSIATFDFAATQTFDPGDAPEKAIFHLHGQHTGFRLLNTEEECNSLGETIRPLFEDSGRRRIWIVVGYSGEQDPVFEQLARIQRFDHRLYWVSYDDKVPPAHVLVRLLA